MRYAFVSSVAEAVANIEGFNRDVANRGSLPPDEERDLQVLIARTELWAVYRDLQGRWYAGPSKYITLRDVSPAQYTKIRRFVHSGNAANHLRLWLPKQPVDQTHPGWKEIEALAKAHTIGGHVQREAVAFLLFDALAASTAVNGEAKLDVRIGESSASDMRSSALVLSELEQRQLDLMVALARAMRPEVRSVAFRQLATI